jgi:hypothetical protein
VFYLHETKKKKKRHLLIEIHTLIEIVALHSFPRLLQCRPKMTRGGGRGRREDEKEGRWRRQKKGRGGKGKKKGGGGDA